MEERGREVIERGRRMDGEYGKREDIELERRVEREDIEQGVRGRTLN